MAAMLRRLFAFIAVLSAMIFLAVAACGVRQHFASDQFHIYRWDPSTRSYSEIYIGSQEGSFGAHCESTKALASDNTAIVQWRARPSNMRIVHDSFPPGWTNEGPLVWGDHYYSTPSFGINRNGLSECWTLEFRLELALIVFAALPGLWGAVWLRRRLRRLSLATRGFAVVADSATGAVDPPQAAEMMPSRSPRMILARPFWRDYVFACVLIGIGFEMTGGGRWAIVLPGFTLLGAGSVVFLCAVGWSLMATWRKCHTRP